MHRTNLLPFRTKTTRNDSAKELPKGGRLSGKVADCSMSEANGSFHIVNRKQVEGVL